MFSVSHPVPLKMWASPAATVTIIMLLFWLLPTAYWIVPQPRTNVWVTLAKAVNQEHLCMSMASAEDPLSTCLVGIPLKSGEFPSTLHEVRHRYNARQPAHHVDSPPVLDPFVLWQEWAATLPKMEGEPQEFELLGSTPAPRCVQFAFTLDYFHPEKYHYVIQHSPELKAQHWCAKVTLAEGSPVEEPRQLPKGIFLVCGDRAWAGIPPRLLGGPCTLGRLSLFAPNQTQILNWRSKNETLAIQKRDLHQLDANCESDIVHWSKTKRIAASVFLPWVAAAKALGELGRLECWVAKQANLTSAALSDLLADEEITRKATLQNRAAIDFLLLAHGHGCQDFEGLCCFNLSSRSESVHSKIQQIHDAISTIKQESEDWLANTFKNWGISGWLTSVLKTVLLVVLVITLIVIALSIFRAVILRTLISHSPTINRVELASGQGWWAAEGPSSRSPAPSDAVALEELEGRPSPEEEVDSQVSEVELPREEDTEAENPYEEMVLQPPTPQSASPKENRNGHSTLLKVKEKGEMWWSEITARVVSFRLS